jgi:hypothetical protein
MSIVKLFTKPIKNITTMANFKEIFAGAQFMLESSKYRRLNKNKTGRNHNQF